jgi:hypothetical protein
MKSRTLTIISLFALVVAMAAASTAYAQSSPAQDVYNPNGEVLDVVQGGGTDKADTNGTVPDTEVCDAADGRDANGKVVSFGSSADCATAHTVCSAADGRDASGNVVSFGSSADCATATPTVTSSQLPFTGFQAGLVGLAGALLLGAGFAMRRVTRRQGA